MDESAVAEYNGILALRKRKARNELRGGYKKNELRHSRGAPHTNHIINNTKTNNRVQRYGDFRNLQ